MTSRKDLIGKYSHSDIFNLIQKPSFKKEKQKRNLNRSNLENTKEQIFNIGKEKRISRKFNKDERISHSTEKRKKNYEKIYGSDIFNLRSKSVERRKGRLHMPNITNRSTCFEEMKNNEEYLKDFQEYTKEKRGNYDISLGAELFFSLTVVPSHSLRSSGPSMASSNGVSSGIRAAIQK